MENIKKYLFAGGFVAAVLLLCGGCAETPSLNTLEKLTLSHEALMNKIKGGWAGQTIGCTYGGPTEFRFNGTMIQDYVPLGFIPGKAAWYYDHAPGLYDDVYMDLTFVEVFDRLGLDAPTDSFALAFAHAEYELWHANQAARYNILHGIMPPMSGHWLNNPHADDIDYQIEADYAGLMAPGMPNAASEVSDRIGHIMNYGDGWYGGVYVGAMYSLAFLYDDVEWIVSEALKVIPAESHFYRCMEDVIRCYREHPEEWREAWFRCQRKWAQDVGCPDGVFVPFNIDATINCAYVVIGLLYGEGDFVKTMDIATRCGQDSDCNPATAAGILGTMMGYDRIPREMIDDLQTVEERNFAHTNISLSRTYQMSFEQALKMIERNGGKVTENEVTIRCQTPVPVGLEKAFPEMIPVSTLPVYRNLSVDDTLSFDGTAFALKGEVRCPDKNYTALVDWFVDGVKVETASLPADRRKRREPLFWKYQLPQGNHSLTFRWTNPQPNASVSMGEAVIYTTPPSNTQK